MMGNGLPKYKFQKKEQTAQQDISQELLKLVSCLTLGARSVWFWAVAWHWGRFSKQ